MSRAGGSPARQRGRVIPRRGRGFVAARGRRRDPSFRLGVSQAGDITALEAHVAQLAVRAAAELGIDGAERAVLRPQAQSDLEQVHRSDLRKDRHRRGLPRGSREGEAPSLIRPALLV